MMSLQDQVDIEYDVQESEWADYERMMRETPELEYLIAKPSPRRTKEQIAARIAGSALSRQNFTMRSVVTGARRNWKRNR